MIQVDQFCLDYTPIAVKAVVNGIEQTVILDSEAVRKVHRLAASQDSVEGLMNMMAEYVEDEFDDEDKAMSFIEHIVNENLDKITSLATEYDSALNDYIDGEFYRSAAWALTGDLIDEYLSKRRG